MKTTILNDQWTLTVLGENVYNIPGTPIRTEVPSTVYSTLLGQDLIPDDLHAADRRPGGRPYFPSV